MNAPSTPTVRLPGGPESSQARDAADPLAAEAPPASLWRLAWQMLRRRPVALASALVLLVMVAAALLAPWVAPFDPLATSWSLVRKAPSAAHWFGTDEVGRDVLSRVIWGARASLSAGLIAVAIAVLVGVPLGMLAGYAGGVLDSVIGRLTDAMLAIPFLILAIALAAFLGPSLGNAMIAIGVSATPIFVRLARGQVLSARAEDWVEAARAVGNPRARILLRHILPNILPPVLVQSTLAIATAIIAEASLSFLGLGQQPPAPSWGSMLNTAQRFLTQAPWLAVFPGLAIFVTVLAFNLLGDALRDALDPRR
jgi:peptide/nickel transport system permease protein